MAKKLKDLVDENHRDYPDSIEEAVDGLLEKGSRENYATEFANFLHLVKEEGVGGAEVPDAPIVTLDGKQDVVVSGLNETVEFGLIGVRGTEGGDSNFDGSEGGIGAKITGEVDLSDYETISLYAGEDREGYEKGEEGESGGSGGDGGDGGGSSALIGERQDGSTEVLAHAGGGGGGGGGRAATSDSDWEGGDGGDGGGPGGSGGRGGTTSGYANGTPGEPGDVTYYSPDVEVFEETTADSDGVAQLFDSELP